MNCGCNICGRSQRVYDITSKLSEEDSQFIHAIYDDLINYQDDAEFYRERYSQAKRYIISEGLSLKDLHEYERYITDVDIEIAKMIKPL
jgi:flagellar biosynthesis chaperone FliJ